MQIIVGRADQKIIEIVKTTQAGFTLCKEDKSYFFLVFVEHTKAKSPRAGRINEKNEMTERIKSQVAFLNKFKCITVFLKKKK